MSPADVRPCVLVIDDDPRATRLMTIVLGNAGYRVVTAPGGAEALERLPVDRPDIVLVDLLMPGMDGLEFCRRVRQLPGPAALPIVLFTAMASGEIDRQARDAGADAVMVKPFQRQALLDELARLLGGMRVGAATDRGARPRSGG